MTWTPLPKGRFGKQLRNPCEASAVVWNVPEVYDRGTDLLETQDFLETA